MNTSNMKSTKWLIGALVLMNLALLAVLFSFKSAVKGGKHHDIGKVLKHELNLSDEQAVKFKNLHDAYVKDAREHYKGIRSMKKEMIEVIASETPDTIEAQNIATEIGRKEVAKEQMLINHYLTLQAECTPEQRQKLKRVFQDRMSRKKKKGKNGQRGK